MFYIALCVFIILQKAAAKKVDWRRKHDEFIHSIRAAREVDEAIKSGKFHTCILPPNNH